MGSPTLCLPHLCRVQHSKECVAVQMDAYIRAFQCLGVLFCCFLTYELTICEFVSDTGCLCVAACLSVCSVVHACMLRACKCSTAHHSRTRSHLLHRR